MVPFSTLRWPFISFPFLSRWHQVMWNCIV
jgi:hypothetical protein